MKIVVLAGYAASLVNFRRTLLQQMVELGHSVVACAPEQDLAMVKQLTSIGVQFRSFSLQRAKSNPARDMFSIISLARLLRRAEPDLVFSYTIKPVIYGSLAARLIGLPPSRVFSMITGLGSVFTPLGLKQRMVRTAAKGLYRAALRCNSSVFLHNSDDRVFLKNHRLADDRTRLVVVNGSGVDLMMYKESQAVLNPITFVLISRLLKSKGIGEFIQAAEIVKRKFPQVRFRVAGPCDANPDAIPTEQVERWSRDGIIEYAGALSDVRPEIAKASVFVLPSYYPEGLPRGIVEAMAMGKPIITTDAPGCRETVEAGRNGFLVPVRDPMALAAAMLKFVTNPRLIEQMGCASRKLVQEKFDVAKVNHVMLSEMGLLPGQRHAAGAMLSR